MSRLPKYATRLAASFLAAAALVMAGPGVAAQGTPRTSDGRPDLQGMWLNNAATPLERPRAYADREFFTEAEARDYEQRYQLEQTAALARNDPFELEVAADIDTYEPGRILPSLRTSLLVDPPGGKLPALKPEAQRQSADRAQHLIDHYAENPEDLPNPERCLMVGHSAAPPLMPVFYNNNVQIVQTGNYVVIVSEMIHDARVIPLDRRTHLPASIRLWKGDSIGRWEGDTLVVDTTNFTDRTTIRGSGSALHLVERFTLSDPDTLTYRFTVEDPAFVRSWTAESAMSRTDGQMFEFACHEANYSMSNVLSGARFAEKNPAKKD